LPPELLLFPTFPASFNSIVKGILSELKNEDSFLLACFSGQVAPAADAILALDVENVIAAVRLGSRGGN
jgi:hypothetical protein